MILAVTIVFIVCSTGWFLFWRTGWPDYLHALNKCDGEPPVVANSFITDTYVKPGDKSYRIPARAGAIENVYFCNENEAIAAGYHHL